MRLLLPILIVLGVCLLRKKISPTTQEKSDLPISKQMLHTALCYSPYLLWFAIISLIAYAFIF